MERVLKGANATQAVASFFLETTPEELESIAKELRAAKPLPGQEVTKKISQSITILWRPEVSTKSFETENGGRPIIGSQVFPMVNATQ